MNPVANQFVKLVTIKVKKDVELEDMSKEEIIKMFKLKTNVSLNNCYLFVDTQKYP